MEWIRAIRQLQQLEWTWPEKVIIKKKRNVSSVSFNNGKSIHALQVERIWNQNILFVKILIRNSWSWISWHIMNKIRKRNFEYFISTMPNSMRGDLFWLVTSRNFNLFSEICLAFGVGFVFLFFNTIGNSTYFECQKQCKLSNFTFLSRFHQIYVIVNFESFLRLSSAFQNRILFLAFSMLFYEYESHENKKRVDVLTLNETILTQFWCRIFISNAKIFDKSIVCGHILHSNPYIHTLMYEFIENKLFTVIK